MTPAPLASLVTPTRHTLEGETTLTGLVMAQTTTTIRDLPRLDAESLAGEQIAASWTFFNYCEERGFFPMSEPIVRVGESALGEPALIVSGWVYCQSGFAASTATYDRDEIDALFRAS